MTAISRMPPRQPDPAADSRNNGTAKRVWLLLFSEGGHWTAEEIGKQLHITRPLWTALGEMVRSGFLERQRAQNVDDELIVRFAVTHRCKVPRGVVVEEIQELLQLAAMARGRQ